MKRSEVNAIITHVKNFLAKHRFMLPEWASWTPEDWKGKYETCSEIIDNKLGWDITDYGSGDFKKRGLALFTIRNGNWNKKDKLYCEKVIMVDEGQTTPLHFHWSKTEDLINRAGGNLVMEFFMADSDNKPSQIPVKISVDGIMKTFGAGEPVVLLPGQSICLRPRIFHRFYPQKGRGKVLIGEVSQLNDDENDNFFYEQVGRFPEIEEDVNPIHLLVNDYKKYL